MNYEPVHFILGKSTLTVNPSTSIIKQLIKKWDKKFCNDSIKIIHNEHCCLTRTAL